MEDDIAREKALVLLDQAFRHQMRGEFGRAIQLYKRSIDTFPTAKAHTFLGWTYSQMDRYDEAIAQCEIAIGLDAEYGNPYNDIGAYLMALDRHQEAIGWLEKAAAMASYETPEFAYTNLGQAYEHLRRFRSALQAYEQALSRDPLYQPARLARRALLGRMC